MRSLLPVLSTLVLLASACGPTQSPLEALADQQHAADTPDLLVLRNPDSENMEVLIDAMRAEVGSDYDLLTLPTTKATSDDLAAAIEQVKPHALVLMDNPSVTLYHEYQQSTPGPYPPGLVVMALFLEQSIEGLENTTGIAYEVPAVTSFVNLRRVITTPVVKVGVLYRPKFQGFVDKQSRLAAMEGFEVVAVDVGVRPSPLAVRKQLRKLQEEVDAIWVLNDNALLSADIITGVWLPELKRNDKPVVVGVTPLLQLPSPFGNFAVVADHAGLGLQAAEMVYELEYEEWDASAVSPQLPIAVETILHAGFARANLGLKEDEVDTIDRVIE